MIPLIRRKLSSTIKLTALRLDVHTVTLDGRITEAREYFAIVITPATQELLVVFLTYFLTQIVYIHAEFYSPLGRVEVLFHFELERAPCAISRYSLTNYFIEKQHHGTTGVKNIFLTILAHELQGQGEFIGIVLLLLCKRLYVNHNITRKGFTILESNLLCRHFVISGRQQFVVGKIVLIILFQRGLIKFNGEFSLAFCRRR